MQLPRHLAAVVFDMDGLLIDSARAYTEALVNVAKQLGYNMTDSAQWVGVMGFELKKRLIENFGAQFPLELYYKDKGVVNMVNVDLFIEMGRKFYGDDSFFGKIDVDDEKVDKILEMQRLIEETSKNLAMLINEILSSVTPSVLC